MKKNVLRLEFFFARMLEEFLAIGVLSALSESHDNPLKGFLLNPVAGRRADDDVK